MSCIIDEKLVRWSKEGPRDFFHEDRNRFAFFSTFLTVKYVKRCQNVSDRERDQLVDISASTSKEERCSFLHD